MPEQFLHGVEVIEIDTGPRPIQTVSSAIIGIVGTAPNSQAAVLASLQTGTAAGNNGITWTSVPTGAGGNDTSIELVDPGVANATLSVAVSGQAITVSLATDAGKVITTTATLLRAAITASTAASALVSTANTGSSTGAAVVTKTRKTFLVDGADEPFPLDTPRIIAGSRAEAAKLGLTGSLPSAIDSILDQTGAVIVVVRVAKGVDATADRTNVIGGVDGPTGAYKGMYAFLSAESAVGVRPRILIAPDFTEFVTKVSTTITGAPVTSELIGIADRLRAVIIADGPNTNDADAIAYRNLFGSKRVYVVDPKVNKYEDGVTIARPASPIAAGVLARIDAEKGFWWSPSNQEINGIVGTARAVDFMLGDYASRANLLNQSQVATVIQQDGYRLWGNRGCASDPKWSFLSVVRTADIINDSIQRAHLWAVDRGITVTYLQEVQDSVNAYLRDLKAQGAIINGNCWADTTLNTPAAISQGKVYFNFDFTPPYPAERVVFRSILTNNYLSELT